MRTRRGFLLLEVMASIIVITGGLLFVMRVYSTARSALERSQTLFRNSLLLEQAAFDFEEKGAVEEGRQDGRLPGSGGYSWQASASPLSPDDTDLSDLEVFETSVFNDKLFTYLFKKRT